MIRAIVADVHSRVATGVIAARFHNALVGWIEEAAVEHRVRQVVFSGGAFQNRYILERSAARLEARGMAVYTHRSVPPNDGGLALGQAVLAGGESLCV